jgi:hypothetical protein
MTDFYEQNQWHAGVTPAPNTPKIISYPPNNARSYSDIPSASTLSSTHNVARTIECRIYE